MSSKKKKNVKRRSHFRTVANGSEVDREKNEITREERDRLHNHLRKDRYSRYVEKSYWCSETKSVKTQKIRLRSERW